MGTYIIHFDDKPWEDLDDELYYRCKEIPWFSTTDTTISRLTPYTEDAAYAHGYTEAESKYREIKDELEKQAHQRGYKEAYDTAYADAEEIYESGKRAMYQKGLKDAWEAARKIRDMSWKEQKEVFGTDYYADIIALPVSECIEKIRQYEQEKEAFHVGDEFENESGKRFVILKMDCDEIDRYIDEEGKTYCMTIKYKTMRKTGRHFPEIAEVLAKMKEENDNK